MTVIRINNFLNKILLFNAAMFVYVFALLKFKFARLENLVEMVQTTRSTFGSSTKVYCAIKIVQWKSALKAFIARK